MEFLTENNNNSTSDKNLVASGSEVDIVLVVLLAHKFDENSAFWYNYIPTDVIFNFLRWYVPCDTSPFLLSKPLVRSYYRICMMRERVEYTWKTYFKLSKNRVDEFKCDLVNASLKVLDFLIKVNNSINFSTYSREKMDNLFDEYILFLLLQYRNTEERVVPSLEIQAIWFSHLLQSGPYRTFIENIDKICNGNTDLLTLNHACVSSENFSGYEIQENLTQLWKFVYNSVDFDLLRSLLLTEYTPQMAIDDQKWLGEFLQFTKGTDYRSLEFREKAHIGYQRMLFLKWKHSLNMEEIGFAPCPSIDLIWHTHLLFPSQYDCEMNNILGYSPKHKLLEEKDRTLVFFNDRDDTQEKMWKENFGESLFNYATINDKSKISNDTNGNFRWR